MRRPTTCLLTVAVGVSIQSEFLARADDAPSGGDKAGASAVQPRESPGVADKTPSKKRALPDYDGRRPAPTTPGDVALWVPRVILSPVYFTTEWVIRRPLGAAVTAAEKVDLPNHPSVVSPPRSGRTSSSRPCASRVTVIASASSLRDMPSRGRASRAGRELAERCGDRFPAARRASARACRGRRLRSRHRRRARGDGRARGHGRGPAHVRGGRARERRRRARSRAGFPVSGGQRGGPCGEARHPAREPWASPERRMAADALRSRVPLRSIRPESGPPPTDPFSTLGPRREARRIDVDSTPISRRSDRVNDAPFGARSTDVNSPRGYVCLAGDARRRMGDEP